jgi:hypothetical protein
MQWRRAVTRLREARQLAPRDASDPEAIDPHPLMREWFGDRLEQTNKAAWKAAHGRLYDHLRDTTHEGQTPTLSDLAPLFHAIAHGCRAGRQQQALDEVYARRVCHRLPSGKIEFYSYRSLGAVSSDLAAVACYFDTPYEMPITALSPRHRRWVFSTAGIYLGAQRRFPGSGRLEVVDARVGRITH